MRKVIVMVTMFGCTTAEPAKPSPTAPTALDEFQLDCRANYLSYLNEANTRIGPTCGQPTMPVTLGTFDQGTSFASLDARHVIKSLTFVCICERDSRQRLANAIQMQKQNYRNGVNRLVSGLSGSSCLDSTVAGDIFEHGYVCAFDAATKSQTLKRAMESDFAQYLPGPPSQATDLAVKCWNSVIPPSSSP
ncbi:MAG: hypothetical protein QM831_43895 [Kofleriaceae bacterium]